MATNKLCLAWCGDLESLKELLSEKYKLNGTWSQPGGDKKVLPLVTRQSHGERIEACYILMGLRQTLFCTFLCETDMRRRRR